MKKHLTLLMVCITLVMPNLFADGTYSVGAGQTYPTLKAAFDAINAGTITGVINLEIAANTTETATAVLNASGSGSATYTSVRVYPVGAARVINSNISSPTIRFDGGDNLTIDGSIGGTGTDKSLTIQNTYVGGNGTIRFNGLADSNTIKNCIIKGTKSGDKGVISFSNANSNNNNTISNNDITNAGTSAADRPYYGINSAGASGKVNSGNEVSNNNFYDLLNTSLTNPSIVNIVDFNTNWTISGNSFYETAAVNSLSNTIVSFIKVGAFTAGNGSSNISVTGNYIGGSAAQCGGTALTKNADATFNNELRAIIVGENPGGAISTNTIQNISWANNSVTNVTMIYCHTLSKNFTIGNNTIGGSDSKKINYTVNVAGTPNLYGIAVESTVTTDAITLSGNFISSLEGANSSGTHALSICGINLNAGVGSVYNNIVSLSPAATTKVYGIYENGLANQNHNLYHNTVYIGGSTSAYPSYALWVNVNTNTRDIRNNIFVNERTNTAGTAKHYGAYFAAAGGTLTANYNNYYATGADGYAGYYDGADVAKTNPVVVTGQDANSTVASPGITPGATAASYKGTEVLSGTSISGITSDYEATTRTVPTMGAFFIPTVVSVASNATSSALSLTAGSQVEVAAGVELTLDGSPSLSKIILAPTAKLSMGAQTITAPNGVVLQSSSSGTATLTGDNAVSNAMVQQYVTAGRNWYMSSPVASAAYSTLNRGSKVSEWNESSKTWSDVVSGTLTPGRGYIQVANADQGTTGTVNFTGTTNAGEVPITLSRTESGTSIGFNLVGNPYPSYLDWSDVIADAGNNGIGTSFWYRTKNTDGAYIFVTHNGTSGYTIPANQTPTTTYNKFIPPMQAFWVRVNENAEKTTHTTTLTFNNTMREHGVGDNNILKAPAVDERTSLRLQLTNGTSADEMLLYFDTNALNTFDEYDSPKMMNNSSILPDLYTVAGSERLAINGMKAITDQMELPLGFTLKAPADLKLTTTELNNLPTTTKVYIVDKLENVQTELQPDTEYNFTSAASTTFNESRFSLLFRAQEITTALETTNKSVLKVYVNADSRLLINAPENSSYSVYNAMGQCIETGYTRTTPTASHTQLATGMYLVKVNEATSRIMVR